MTLPGFEKSTLCICPMCGKKHKKKMNWKGNGLPKKFCKTCKKIAECHGSIPEWRE